MSLSARNQFEGTVSAIQSGPISAEVSLTLSSGETIIAGITSASVSRLGLAVGKPALAIVKAPLVMLVAGTPAWRFSARNQLAGTVERVTPGSVNASVLVKLSGGALLSSIVTQAAVDEMALAAGSPVTALFKAGSVVLGVPL